MSYGEPDPASGSGRIAEPPSMVDLAVDALKRLILSGEVAPGDRLVEYRLTDQLGISRPPLREALRILEREGLVVQLPRRGVIVRTLTREDVYEIVTLRHGLERLAVELGVPVQNPALLAALERTLVALETNSDESRVNELAMAFHTAFVALAHNSRLESAFQSISLQLLLCMSLNRESLRERESLTEHAARHRRLYDTVVGGDRDVVLNELEHHGDDHFLFDVVDRLEPGSARAEAWIVGLRGGDSSAAR